MRRVRVADRRAAVEHYLSLERLKGTPEPPGRDQLDFDDPNELNAWLTEGRYKVGVISGFLRWAFVELAPDEIRDCAVVAGITGNDAPQNLGELERGAFLVGWQPKNPGHYWDGFVGAGRSIPQEWAVILRPGMPSPATENSRWYVEDGSGRMTQLIQRSNSTEHAFAYVGFDPDPRSVWLSHELGGHFIFQHRLYDTEGDVLGLKDAG